MLNSVITAALRGGLGKVLGAGGAPGGAMGGAMGGAVGQAAVVAALGMLLRRGGAGRLMKVGGMAALGMMAYKSWQAYQARQAGSSAAAATTGVQGKAFAAPSADAPNEAHEQALLAAMIAAAKADGHVDDNERAQIEQALRTSDGQPGDPALLAWLDVQLKQPLNAAAIARPAVGDLELASKLYLASVIVAGGGGGNVSAEEQAWLDALARELGLPEELKVSLRTQAAQIS